MKNQILNDFKTLIENCSLNFKKVERGLVSIEDVKNKDLPFFCFNSSLIQLLSEIYHSYNRKVFKMDINFMAIFNDKQNYYQTLDNASETLVELIDDNEQFSANVINTDISIDESVNDNYVDGMIVLSGTINVIYYKER